MARCADAGGRLIVGGDFLVFVIPHLAADRVHTVWTFHPAVTVQITLEVINVEITAMTGAAFRDCAGVPLELHSCHVVIGIGITIRPDSMGSPVAGFEEDPFVTCTDTIEFRVACCMACSSPTPRQRRSLFGTGRSMPVFFRGIGVIKGYQDAHFTP